MPLQQEAAVLECYRRVSSHHLNSNPGDLQPPSHRSGEPESDRSNPAEDPVGLGEGAEEGVQVCTVQNRGEGNRSSGDGDRVVEPDPPDEGQPLESQSQIPEVPLDSDLLSVVIDRRRLLDPFDLPGSSPKEIAGEVFWA